MPVKAIRDLTGNLPSLPAKDRQLLLMRWRT